MLARMSNDLRALEDGQEVQLVQHVSQVNVLLVAVKALQGHPARRIGFDATPKSDE